MTLSSYNNINIGSADNLQIFTNNSTIIESKNIYLGESAVKGPGVDDNQPPGEPLVMGDALRKLLLNLANIISTLKTNTFSNLNLVGELFLILLRA